MSLPRLPPSPPTDFSTSNTSYTQPQVHAYPSVPYWSPNAHRTTLPPLRSITETQAFINTKLFLALPELVAASDASSASECGSRSRSSTASSHARRMSVGFKESMVWMGSSVPFLPLRTPEPESDAVETKEDQDVEREPRMGMEIAATTVIKVETEAKIEADVEIGLEEEEVNKPTKRKRRSTSLSFKDSIKRMGTISFTPPRTPPRTPSLEGLSYPRDVPQGSDSETGTPPEPKRRRESLGVRDSFRRMSTISFFELGSSARADLLDVDMDAESGHGLERQAQPETRAEVDTKRRRMSVGIKDSLKRMSTVSFFESKTTSRIPSPEPEADQHQRQRQEPAPKRRRTNLNFKDSLRRMSGSSLSLLLPHSQAHLQSKRDWERNRVEPFESPSLSPIISLSPLTFTVPSSFDPSCVKVGEQSDIIAGLEIGTGEGLPESVGVGAGISQTGVQKLGDGSASKLRVRGDSVLRRGLRNSWFGGLERKNRGVAAF